MSKSIIKIIRAPAYADSLRLYKIMVDGEVREEIADGDSKAFTIEPGLHTIYVKMDWVRSNKIKFETANSETTTFECSSNITGSKIPLAAFYAIFLSTRYLKLKKLQA